MLFLPFTNKILLSLLSPFLKQLSLNSFLALLLNDLSLLLLLGIFKHCKPYSINRQKVFLTFFVLLRMFVLMRSNFVHDRIHWRLCIVFWQLFGSIDFFLKGRKKLPAQRICFIVLINFSQVEKMTVDRIIFESGHKIRQLL